MKRVHVWVERSRSDRIGWSVAPGRERNGNVMLQLTLAIQSLSFFPIASWYWTPLCSTWVTILPFEIKMASFSKSQICYYASSKVEQFFPIGESVPLWVEWSRNEKAEQSKRSEATSFARSANARATPGWTASCVYNRYSKFLCIDHQLLEKIRIKRLRSVRKSFNFSVCRRWHMHDLSVNLPNTFFPLYVV